MVSKTARLEKLQSIFIACVYCCQLREKKVSSDFMIIELYKIKNISKGQKKPEAISLIFLQVGYKFTLTTDLRRNMSSLIITQIKERIQQIC